MDSATWWQGHTSTDTPSAGRCWWGWGDVEPLKKMFGGAGPEAMVVPPPTVAECILPAPRLCLSDLPEDLRGFTTDSKFERLLHAGGRDFLDLLRNIHGAFVPPKASIASGVVDLVAFPWNDSGVFELLKHCSKQGIACVPFGGGSSVCQGIEPPSAEALKSGGLDAVISLDMRRMDALLEVDNESMAVRVQAGCYGPALESKLRPLGLTVRHFPQSFEFSTVGGWVATRGGGHFATHWTHIDDMVQSVKIVTPRGITETARLPGSGAGPAEHRFYVGSEGTLGVITEVWLRVRRRPKLRASATVLFDSDGDIVNSFSHGAAAVQAVVQAGIEPANLRLVDGPELFRMTGEAATESASAVLIGFEAAEATKAIVTEMNAAIERTLGLCFESGGTLIGDIANTKARSGSSGERDDVTVKWGNSFIQGGYLFSIATVQGMLLNTFETCITWAAFPAFHKEVTAVVHRTVAEACGGAEAHVTCRFTHVYPDGPAPYYTVAVPNPLPAPCPSDDRRAGQWKAIKVAVTRVMVAYGAACTHHHAVGKLHRPHYEAERGNLFGESLRALKSVHDPAGILNPDVLLQTSGATPEKTSELGAVLLQKPKL